MFRKFGTFFKINNNGLAPKSNTDDAKSVPNDAQSFDLPQMVSFGGGAPKKNSGADKTPPRSVSDTQNPSARDAQNASVPQTVQSAPRVDYINYKVARTRTVSYAEQLARHRRLSAELDKKLSGKD